MHCYNFTSGVGGCHCCYGECGSGSDVPGRDGVVFCGGGGYFMLVVEVGSDRKQILSALLLHSRSGYFNL